MNTTAAPANPVIEKPAKPSPASERPQEPDPGEFLPWLPCTLALDIPVINFTVRDLMTLAKGSIVETSYHQSSDLPLRVNGQLVGWTEFEVVGDRLAVRLTDLS
jgi:flagellar motor switch/type III secretory pathway protein FliN